jgi:hypothetical protein
MDILLEGLSFTTNPKPLGGNDPTVIPAHAHREL